MRRVLFLLIVCLMISMLVTGTALAAFPSGAQGNQYAAVVSAMQVAAAQAGISPDTFIAIYNAAAAGNVSGFSDSQLAAACQVLSSLSSYKSVLPDYNTVYNNLGCSTRLTTTAQASSLPSTGTTVALLIASGLIGIAAASVLLRRARRQS